KGEGRRASGTTIRYSLFARPKAVDLPPTEPVLGAAARLVFAAHPAVVTDAFERFVDRRIIDLALVGLLAARHRGDLHVADHGEELLDAFYEIALGDLHVIAVELQAHVRAPDLGDHVGAVLDAREEIAGPVTRVERLDQELDVLRAGEIGGAGEVCNEHRVGG